MVQVAGNGLSWPLQAIERSRVVLTFQFLQGGFRKHNVMGLVQSTEGGKHINSTVLHLVFYSIVLTPFCSFSKERLQSLNQKIFFIVIFAFQQNSQMTDSEEDKTARADQQQRGPGTLWRNLNSNKLPYFKRLFQKINKKSRLLD